ncbi:NAD-dependent epimerase/dehydratase family protein [Myxococcota bacterium]|nr:NAD-dependent epimerase/dehydratase family protein [Myxococcota bacterium]MBU1431891.1 NAD-dependent epimerase/dehydratase family protein [Myxococcota bacterium]MBU1896957.1 NAD-dependent epimerase/dehydratase family protein [Myxococcota bacterium]
MRVLVTGSAGFIGSHLCDRLLREGHEVTGLDNFNDFYDPQIKERHIHEALKNSNFQQIRGDILDDAALDRAMDAARPQRVIHLAAYAGVRPSIERPQLYQRVNVEGTTRILEACRARGVDRLIFASSSSVYGDRAAGGPFSEADRVDTPASPYAATKKAGELLCYTWHHLFGLHVSALRFFTVYGPRQRPEMAIHKFTRALEAGEPIPLFGDGTSERDYTYIDDIIAGIVAALARVEGYQIYNLGGAEPIALSGLIKALGVAVGVEPQITRLPAQPGDVTRTSADVRRAAADLGYAPQIGLEEGLRRFVAWYRQQPR